MVSLSSPCGERALSELLAASKGRALTDRARKKLFKAKDWGA